MSNLQTDVEKLNIKHKRKGRWYRVMSVLAAVVVFCTTYALILPAITMEKKTYCGITDEAHEHSEECYIDSRISGNHNDSLLDSDSQEALLPELNAANYPEQQFRALVEDSMSVEVVAPEYALPVGTSMYANPVNREEVMPAVLGAVNGEIVNIVAVDISFQNSFGAEIEPLGPLQVTITSEVFAREYSEPVILHIDDEGEATEVAVSDDFDSSGNQLLFEAEMFSVYAIVYTVDFELGGHTFSINGYDSIKLSELFEMLEMDVAIDDVAEVTFSNPDYLAVEALIEGDESSENPRIYDWKLISLAPFDTEERLTIRLRDGSTIVVIVTDAQRILDLTKVITDVALFLDDERLDWTKPLLLREKKYYDLRLTFKENNTYQFVDTDEWMTYPLPEGIELGVENFERTFTMSVDDARLSDNILRYDSTLNMFFIKWNTEDTLGFNKLKASNNAEFRVDLQVMFNFNPDVIDFGNDIVRDVIRDTTAEVAIEKTGEYDKDNDRVDYTVSVTSYGNSYDVLVKDVLFGTALSFIDDGTESHGITWQTTRNGGNASISNPVVEYYETADLSEENTENTSHILGSPKGFSLVIGDMADGETIDFHYSAKVDYEVLANGSGKGDFNETFNTVTATANGDTVEATHYFEGELRYVELQKTRATVNWGSGDTTTVNWTVRVNNKPKVGLAGTLVRDHIYAGDLEAMDYSGDGIHVKVYDASGVFVGEYDVPWEALTRTHLEYNTEKEAAIDQVSDWSTLRQAEELAALLAKDEEELTARERALIEVLQGDRTPYTYAQWEYTIPQSQSAVNGDATVWIDNTQKYYYDISYTTLADKTLMNFDGYVGNEAKEFKTGSMMQGGLFPPGIGQVPEVEKEAISSNENYIYWKISFQRQNYNMTRCVIEDNNPTLYGRREPIDIGPKDADDLYALRTVSDSIMGTDSFVNNNEPFEILYVTGLTSEERWQITSPTTTRTTFKFYQNESQPGLLQKGEGREDTICIYLRTENSSEWIQGTMTKYWPRDHVNNVTWVANAHQVYAEATETPDIRKIEKIGKQVGTVIENGVSLAVFRYELYLTGITADDFYIMDGDTVIGTKNLAVYDSFNTKYLAFVDIKGNATVTGKKTLTDEQKLDLGVMSNWDQALKGYSKTNKWVGPVAVAASDYQQGGELMGVTFTVTPEDFERKGYEPDEDGVYCLRYSLPYYLMIKDANAAKDLAGKTDEELAAENITKENDIVKFGNTATWSGVSVPAVADAEANFKPMTKSVVYDANSDTCTYTLVINPQRLRLNDGCVYKVEDSYTNLAVDFSTVGEGLTVYPEENKNKVNWAYHNNIGTFWVPDETAVTITYQAKPIGDPGKSVTFSNTLTMLNYAPEVVEKTVTLNSESEGSAGDYNIRLFKYADNSMNIPLEGAVFQLFEESPTGAKVPVTYETTMDVDTPDNPIPRYSTNTFNDYELLRNMQPVKATNKDGSTGTCYPTREVHREGDYIYFCTTKAGYADIHLNMSLDGVALDRGKQYYLQEIVTPDNYSGEMMKDSEGHVVRDEDGNPVPLFWSFIIDDMDFFDSANGIYVYRDNGELTVSNTSNDSGFVLRKEFAGDVPAWEDQKDITYEIKMTEKNKTDVLLQTTVTYGDFVKDFSDNSNNSGYRLKLRPDELNVEDEKTYVFTVTEKNHELDTHDCTTTIETQLGAAAKSGPEQGVVATVEATGYQISNDIPVRVWFKNTYTAKPVDLTINKEWGTQAATKYDKEVTFVLHRTGLKPGQDAKDKETITIALYWDESQGAYIPYKDYTSEAWESNGNSYPITVGVSGTQNDSFVLNDRKGWSVKITGLPRYDQKGNAYVYSAQEVKVTYKDEANGAVKVAEGDDIDVRFIISAVNQTTVQEPDPQDSTQTIDVVEESNAAMKSTTEAEFDLYHKLAGSLKFTNEIATLIDVTIEKVWPEGEDHTGEEVTYDLYRTTEALPAGGKERKLFHFTRYIDENGTGAQVNLTSYNPQELEIANGDEIEFTIYIDQNYRYAEGWKDRNISLNGIQGHIQNAADFETVLNEFLSEYPDGGSGHNQLYCFDPIHLYKNDEEHDYVNDTYLNGGVVTNIVKYGSIHEKTVNMPHTVLTDVNDYARFVYRVDHIEMLGGLYRGYDASETLWFRGPYQRPVIVTNIRNLTAESENLTRQKLESVSDRTLVRSGLTLEEVNNWKISAQYPREDAQGNQYYYYVLENPVPAGYVDEYSVEIVQDLNDPAPEKNTREHHIYIKNKVETPEPGETTSLTINKEVRFNPADSNSAEADAALAGKNYYVTVTSGSKYVVKLGDGTYALKSPSQIASHNEADAGGTDQWSAYLTITVGTPLVIQGIPKGFYVINEINDDETHDAELDGYTLDTTYSPSQTVNLSAASVARTITNTYSPIPKSSTTFYFYKLWNSKSDRQPVEWPTDQEINLSFYRAANNVKDDNFKVTFTVRRTYNAADNEMVWVIARDPSAQTGNDPDVFTDLYMEPALEATRTPGRYFKYEFTLSGVREKDDNDVLYDYYVEENVPDDSDFSRSYGVVLGTSASPVETMQHAEQGKAIINTFEQAELNFIKQWYGQDHSSILTEWPEREVEIDPESDQGAQPHDVPETEPVTMSIRIGRKLEYTDASGTHLSKDFDSTYRAGFNNLTGYNHHLESYPSEGKITLEMVNNNGSFTYKITGLKETGTMTIDGEVKKGTWKYYVFEDYVYGYLTSYYQSTGDDNDPWDILDDVSVPNGGRIVNTQQLGTLLINKNVVMPANTRLGEKTYSFVVRRKRATNSKGQDKYLLQNGSLTANYTVHTVTISDDHLTGNWLYFYDVIPGDYEIEEIGTGDGGNAQIPGYQLSVTPLKTVVGDDGTEHNYTIQTKTLEGNNKVPAEFTNTYEIIKTKKAFQKVWLPMAGSENDTVPVEWSDGESITIELRRFVVDDKGTEDTSDDTEVKDENFILVYKGRKENGQIVWTSVAGDSKSLETDEDQVLITEATDGNVYNIKFERLTKCVLSGEFAGKDWEYYITERAQERTDYAVHYGKVENGAANVDTTIEFAHGNDINTVVTGEGENATSTDLIDTTYNSAVINRADYTHARITKVWQDGNGETIPWPKDGGGADVSIRITATGKMDGQEDDIQVFTLSTAEPGEGDEYRLEVVNNEYAFTLYKLLPGYAYTFTEADIIEYIKSYKDANDEALPDGFPENGMVINRRNPLETASVKYTKVWEDGKTFNGNNNLRLYKALNVNDPNKILITIQTRALDNAGNRVASSGNYVAWGYIYLYDANYTQIGGRKGFGISYATNVDYNFLIVDKVISGKEVRYARLEVPNLNSSSYVEKGTIWLPSANGYYACSQALNIPLDLTATAASERWPASNGYYWFYPDGAYDHLPENAIPTRYTYGKWNAGDNFSDSVANKGWSYWDSNLQKTVYTTELPAYEQGYPLTYYVVEESVTTNREADKVKLIEQGVAVEYAREPGTNNWTLTNKSSKKDLEFKKEWYNANGGVITWPLQDKVNAGDPDVYLPVSIQVTRRLKYQIGETDYTSADQDAGIFSLTYNVMPSGSTLIKINGKDPTAEDLAKYQLTLTSGDSTPYAFKIEGLERLGSLGTRSGEWDYRVTELRTVSGFADPEYYDAQGTGNNIQYVKVPNGGIQIGEDGLIRNNQLPVTQKVSVTKEFINAAGHWPQDGFTFRLEYAGPGEAAGNVVMPDNVAVKVTSQTPDLTGIFDAIAFKAPGTYTFRITESIPNPESVGNVRNYIEYDIAPHAVSISVSEVDGRLVAAAPVYESDESSFTITNTYNGPVGFEFGKVWLKADTTLPTTDFEEWPADKEITVTLKRKAKETAEAAAETEDVGFALIYTIRATGVPVLSDSSIEGGAALTSAAKTRYAIARTDEDDNWYSFTIGEVLDAVNSAGQEYTYYVTEAPVSGYESTAGELDVDDQVVSIAGLEVPDKGVLINRNTKADFRITKIWRDPQGAAFTTWPTGKTIDLLLKDKTDDAFSLSLTGLAANGVRTQVGETDYYVTVSDSYPFVITVDGLPYMNGTSPRVYTATETKVDGYVSPAYSTDGINEYDKAYDGGIISNTLEPLEGVLSVGKTLIDGTNENGTVVSDSLWPESGFTFSLAFEKYVDTENNNRTFTENLDEKNRPLVNIPENNKATVRSDTLNKKSDFDAIEFLRPGIYTFSIREDHPDGAAETDGYYRSGDIYYEYTKHMVTVTVTKTAGGAMTLESDAIVYESADGLTVTNFHGSLPNKAGFSFSKVWLAENTTVETLTGDDYATWPQTDDAVSGDVPITVVLKRYADTTEDQSFRIVYTLNGTDNSFHPSNVRGAADESGTDYDLWLTKSGNMYTYTMASHTLDKKNPESIPYVYVIVEDQADGYEQPKYGRNEGATIIYDRILDSTGALDTNVILNKPEADAGGGYELPSTGGIGSEVVSITGAVILAAAAAGLAANRKRRGQQYVPIGYSSEDDVFRDEAKPQVMKRVVPSRDSRKRGGDPDG